MVKAPQTLVTLKATIAAALHANDTWEEWVSRYERVVFMQAIMLRDKSPTLAFHIMQLLTLSMHTLNALYDPQFVIITRVYCVLNCLNCPTLYCPTDAHNVKKRRVIKTF